MSRRKPNPAHYDGVGTNLVAECEAFISGAYAAHLQARGQPVPAWAWINRPAHAARADIEVLAAAAYGDTPEALTSCIAAHLLAVTQRRGISLESLQHDNLLPLESLLAANAGEVPPKDQDDLARALSSALAERARTSVDPDRPGP